ncbi:hypothetical protein BGZ63DRAFT_430125 [Mariannaea sp. PMI_226]|nr:hypothetical protein BGZ63DRAFT_430125 [Mariannaea sp. PMI_226]
MARTLSTGSRGLVPAFVHYSLHFVPPFSLDSNSSTNFFASSAGVDQLILDSFCLCLPSFPNSRSGESDSLPRSLPVYSGPELSTSHSDLVGVSAGAPLPRVLPLKPEAYPVQPPPYYPGRSTSLEVKPLRLVRTSRKRRSPRKPSPPPPSYYETYSYTLYQSVTTLSIEPADSPPTYLETMASQPAVVPKPGTETGPRQFGPAPGGNTPPRGADNVLADLRRQLDDSASESGSSVDSRGRRRRRRRNNKQLAASGGINTGPVLPRLSETKPVRLQLGLNLDVEVELKARLQGDVSLTLLVEKKQTARKSTELRPNLAGEVSVEELFFMRLGTMKFRQKWLQREVSASLTVSVMLVIGAAGFILGFASSRFFDSWGGSRLVLVGV